MVGGTSRQSVQASLDCRGLACSLSGLTAAVKFSADGPIQIDLLKHTLVTAWEMSEKSMVGPPGQGFTKLLQLSL
jgi:hypothetical protein